MSERGKSSTAYCWSCGVPFEDGACPNPHCDIGWMEHAREVDGLKAELNRFSAMLRQIAEKTCEARESGCCYCHHCDGAFRWELITEKSYERGRIVHAAGCPWVAARRALGIRGELPGSAGYPIDSEAYE